MSQTDLVQTREEKLFIHNLVKRDPLTGLAEDVRNGLTAQRKRFLPKYFYDELGSQLFEAICLLPEYYPTRAENEILEQYADEIVASVDDQITLVEMGSGSASKTRLLIEALLRRQQSLLYMPVDISATALESSSRILLQSFGADLKKDPAMLEAAYNDALGVTAAFNLNVLARINRELGGNFDLRAFKHHAFYNEARGRVEIYIKSLCSQKVKIKKLDLEVEFGAGELIHTENSYKYDLSDISQLAAMTGFACTRSWLDSEERFSSNLLLAS